jgi:predicted enzyme related to lactoylglutathione lyase
MATTLFAGMPVADLDPAIAWYERFFGREPDMWPNDREAVWQVSREGWVYVVADEERSGSALLTIIVDDLDAKLGELTEAGIETGPIDTLPRAVRRTELLDPAGNRIQLGQPLT